MAESNTLPEPAEYPVPLPVSDVEPAADGASLGTLPTLSEDTNDNTNTIVSSETHDNIEMAAGIVTEDAAPHATDAATSMPVFDGVFLAAGTTQAEPEPSVREQDTTHEYIQTEQALPDSAEQAYEQPEGVCVYVCAAMLTVLCGGCG